MQKQLVNEQIWVETTSKQENQVETIKKEEKRVETTSEPVETMLNQKKQVFFGKKQTNVGK